MKNLNPIEFTDLAVKESNNLPAKDNKSGLIFIGILALIVILYLVYHNSRLIRENKELKGVSNVEDPKNNRNEDE